MEWPGRFRYDRADLVAANQILVRRGTLRPTYLWFYFLYFFGPPNQNLVCQTKTRFGIWLSILIRDRIQKDLDAIGSQTRENSRIRRGGGQGGHRARSGAWFTAYLAYHSEGNMSAKSLKFWGFLRILGFLHTIQLIYPNICGLHTTVV